MSWARFAGLFALLTAGAAAAAEQADPAAEVPTIEATGRRSLGEVEAVLGRYDRKLLKCHAKAAKTGAIEQGTVAVRFKVLGDGTVTDVAVDADLGRPDFADCVTERVEAIRFLYTSDDTEVTWPVAFEADR